MRTEVHAATIDAERELELRMPIIGHVVEVLDGTRIRARVPIYGLEYVTADCVEHVVDRKGGLESLIGRQVLIACVAGDAAQAIVYGVIGTPLSSKPTEVEVDAPRPTAAVIDGERVVLDAESEIVLRCGRSSLTLTSDGRIVMKGIEIVSRAVRTNKIKGGTVNIN